MSINRVRDVLEQNAIDVETLRVFADTGAGEICAMALSGKEALSLWELLRTLVESTSCWPVLIGEENLADYRDMAENRQESVAQILEAGLALDPLEWLRQREAEYARMFEREIAEIYASVAGEWPRLPSANHEFTIPYEVLGGKPRRQIWLAFVPTTRCWEVPAFLSNGGWNDCPEPAAQVCMMKRWHEIYGAEIVGQTWDVTEARVARPPADRSQALELAREQFLYCSDIVFQGTQTLEGLAALVLNGTAWYFWWD